MTQRKKSRKKMTWDQVQWVSVSQSVGVVVLLQPSHQGGHQLLQLFGPQPPRLQDLFVVGLLLAVVVHHRPVADQRQGEATHPSVAGSDDLVDSTHPCSKDRGGEKLCCRHVSACCFMLVSVIRQFAIPSMTRELSL